MSIKAMVAVWERSKQKGSALLLELYLANCAHDDGSSIYPSVKTMARHTRLSERSVQYALRDLEASGEIRREGLSPRGTPSYSIGVQILQGGAKYDTEGVQPVAPDPSVRDPSDLKRSPLYPPAFEELWKLYPERAGSNPKRAAYASYSATITRYAGRGISGEVPTGSGIVWSQVHAWIQAGLERYVAYLQATGKTATEYVMQMSRFCGRDEPWREDWRIPVGRAGRRAEQERINNDLRDLWQGKDHVPETGNRTCSPPHRGLSELDSAESDPWPIRRPTGRVRV